VRCKASDCLAGIAPICTCDFLRFFVPSWAIEHIVWSQILLAERWRRKCALLMSIDVISLTVILEDSTDYVVSENCCLSLSHRVYPQWWKSQFQIHPQICRLLFIS
jgi:hypothetical protein